jgi:hypothetical protein
MVEIEKLVNIQNGNWVKRWIEDANIQSQKLINQINTDVGGQSI